MPIRWEVVSRGRATCDVCQRRLPKGTWAIPFGVSVMHGTLYFCGTECMDRFNREPLRRREGGR